MSSEGPTNAFSRREAAKYIGIAEATLATMATRGGGPVFVRIGRRCVYLRADLDAFLAARRVRSTSGSPRQPLGGFEE